MVISRESPLRRGMVNRRELSETSSYRTREIVSEIPEITPRTLEVIQAFFHERVAGQVDVLSSSDARKKENIDRKLIKALGYSGSVILDTGSIGNLTDAVPQVEQEFSTLDIAQALRQDGLIQDDERYLKMGASGAVVNKSKGAEVIEAQYIASGEAAMLGKTASQNEQGVLMAQRSVDPARVLLENEFIVRNQAAEKGKSILIRLELRENFEQDLIAIIDQAAQAAGLEHYTVRATIVGPVQADVAVISRLPERPIQSAAEIASLLVVGRQEAQSSENIFHFVGSRSTAETRVNQRWQELTGSRIYPGERAGHYHGYSEDGKMGGHIRNLRPQAGSRVEIILEPAKVVAVEKK